jgi:hypothetical protein
MLFMLKEEAVCQLCYWKMMQNRFELRRRDNQFEIYYRCLYAYVNVKICLWYRLRDDNSQTSQLETSER